MRFSKIGISWFLIILSFLVPLLLAGCTKPTGKNVPQPKKTQIEESKDLPNIQLPKDEAKQDNAIPENAEEVTVLRVVDGDTFETAKGEKVRLVGVDTPESVKPNHPIEPYGKEASNFTKRTIEGKKIFLTFDIEPKDQYGRSLAYLFLQDGTFFNELLVKEGYAQVMTVPPNVQYQELFLEAQRYARENSKGLWGLEETKNELTRLWVDEKGKGLIKGSKSKIYHLPDGYYYSKTTNVVKWFKTEQEAIDAGYRKSSK